MKLKLETIPVWDAFEKDSECALCLLMEGSHKDAVAYYTGSSVMHPETRQEVNRKGFCPTHWHSILEGGSAQSVALLSHTFLLETMKGSSGLFSAIPKESKAKRLKKVAGELRAYLKGREEGCLVCDRMAERRNRYLYTIVKLFCDDEEFREKFTGSKGICLYHTQDLLVMAGKVLKDPDYLAFVAALSSLTKRNLERIEADVLWMTQKYKAEYRDEPWKGCEDAQRRNIGKLTGQGRLFVSPKGED